MISWGVRFSLDVWGFLRSVILTTTVPKWKPGDLKKKSGQTYFFLSFWKPRASNFFHYQTHLKIIKRFCRDNIFKHPATK